MKKHIMVSLFFLMFAVVAGSAFAQVPCDCTQVLAGEPVVITGVVATVPDGDGLEVAVGDEVVTVFGLGPQWYWKSLEVAKPTEGDQVEIDARVVTLTDGTQVTIMMSITINGVLVELRDPETGCPLWK